MKEHMYRILMGGDPFPGPYLIEDTRRDSSTFVANGLTQAAQVMVNTLINGYGGKILDYKTKRGVI